MRWVVIGGVESADRNVKKLKDLGETVLKFYSRGPETKGLWNQVARYLPKEQNVKVVGSINDYVKEIQELRPDIILSSGWAGLYSRELMDISQIIGFHESPLPEGAGHLPYAQAIINDEEIAGVTLFRLPDGAKEKELKGICSQELWCGGADVGNIITQRILKIKPKYSTSTELFNEGMDAQAEMIEEILPELNRTGELRSYLQDFSQRTVYTKKIVWDELSDDIRKRARTYPYE